ncbi:MAG: Holliday junction resolvase RuvX [Elusimicrobia bacterium]|nr:Holliday junction resolvase RuvX [Elusimicrobiota bacterium]
MIVLGVDWGRVRTGVAVSDEMGLLAHPVESLRAASAEDLIRELVRLSVERRAEEIVLGLPVNMDGTEGESAALVRRLADQLRAASGRPVVLWDERLTTWEAERLLSEGKRLSRSKKKEVKDQIAACLILQSYLDSKKRPPQ